MSKDVPVVVFDFDLTLTRWDTSERFFRWALRRAPWRLALLVAALPLLAPLLLTRRTRQWPIRFAVWVATLGCAPASLPALAEAHLRSLPFGHASVFLPEALAQLRSHLAQGHQVVIATGCLEPLAQALLQQAGLGHVPLVASRLRPFLGGLVRDQHCIGANKIPMLAARGFPPPWAAAYTDHRADLPLLRLSKERYLVNPTATCRARIGQALRAEPTVLAWR